MERETSQESSNQPIKDEDPPIEEIVKKKSILVTRTKEPSVATINRLSSKATIQWKEDKYPSYQTRNLTPPIRMVTRGTRWREVSEIMLLFQLEGETIKRSISFEEEILPARPKISDILLQEFGLDLKQKRTDKGVELTLDQQAHLEVLKQNIQAENDRYLKRHPELDLLLLMVYRELFKTQPDNPKLFVADYVHYLNTHREMMVWEEVNVPFDKPPEPQAESETTLTVDKERQKINAFARKLIERCARIAYQGAAYVDVTSMLDFLLYNISPSERSEDSLGERVSPRGSAESAVADVLSLLLASVNPVDDTSTSSYIDEILNSILRNIHHSIKTDSEVYLEMRESVERFVKTLLKTTVAKASRDVKEKE